jgi:branched-chain amino acid transport system ATP-binding protein
VSSEPLLELRGVSVAYGPFTALSDVSYRVRPGEMVCLLGGNASGKSTSMKAVFGTVRLAAGEVLWCGERISGWPTERRVRAGLAAVPEGRRVFARLTVEENLMAGAYQRRDALAVARDLDEMYELFPRLADRRQQPAGTMSGGEQQMVALARALMSRPRLVCMDEPSMGLAPALVRQSFALIQSIRERGTAVFVVEQNANAALRIADYAYVLQTGRVRLEGTAVEVAADPAMREAYLGRRQEE